MVKIKILKTGEIKEVTSNIAHGLIDSGVAVLAISDFEKYQSRQMTNVKDVRGKVTRKYKAK